MSTSTLGTQNRPKNLHWNYFLALEHDLNRASRYIEFCQDNFKVYSIEFAHLLLAAASEVDVLAKCICERVAPKLPRNNINDYRAAITAASLLPGHDPNNVDVFTEINVLVPRYRLRFKPWKSWAESRNPDWWQSYNNVKHERNEYFNEATLENALNAMAGLLIMNYQYYSLEHPNRSLSPAIALGRLAPESSLLRFPHRYYCPDGLEGIMAENELKAARRTAEDNY